MKKRWWLGGGLLAIAVLAGAVWFFFLRDDAPAEVDNDAANEQLDSDLAAEETEPTTSETEPTTSEPVLDESIDGTWVVNSEIGEFTFDSASGSFAGFRVAEELDLVGETTAVGRSGEVTGTLTIEDETLTVAEVVVDMTTIVSDRAQRQSAIRRAVNATEFPTATFVFADSVDVSGLEVGGAPLAISVEGELTVAGVTRSVTFDIEANVRDDGFGVVTGQTEIVWEDFGVTPPSAPIVVSVADEGTVEFQLVLEKA